MFHFQHFLFPNRVAFFPLQMGDHVFVGERAVVNAAVVGSYVYIGKNAIIVSKNVNIHDLGCIQNQEYSKKFSIFLN